MELEFDMLGVVRKLVKYVVHLSKKNTYIIEYLSLYKVSK
jgi:hypothetical protein